ncbi:MAG: GIDE domain-containing protein [Oceanococcus sp.]
MQALSQAAAVVRQLDQVEFGMLLAISLAVSVGCFFAVFSMLKRARLIQDTPTSKIRSAAQGHVELEGIANLLPGEPVVSPLSGQICTWWKYSIEEKRTSYNKGKRHSNWTTIESAVSDDLFELSDDTGRCVVDPEGAQVIPNRKLNWSGNSRRPRHTPSSSPLIRFGNYRYHEATIRPASALYALGWFRTEGGIAHSFNDADEVRDLLSEWKADQQQLLRQFDENNDGKIDLQEWENVRVAAMQKVRETQLQRAVEPDIHVLCRPPRRQRFLLSTVPQDKLISQSRRNAIFALALFLLCGSLSVWLGTVRGLV